MAEIPQSGRAGRKYRREVARQLAKEILKNQGQPQKRKREWDAGWFLAAFLAFALWLLAPKVGRPLTTVTLGAMAACLAPPIWKLRFVQSASRKWLTFSGVMLIAVVSVALFGVYVWPPIKRHVLNAKERAAFENNLRTRKDGDLEVQIACPMGDEKTCIYARQFISLFGESEWKVQPLVARVTLTKASDGVVVYRRGGNRDDMMRRWNSGGYFNINEPRLLAVQSAFRAIHIEINGGTNPDLGENLMMVYFGPEKDNEAEPNDLTRETDWATGKAKGPFPQPQHPY
jgi:hypothetical protein